MSVQGTFQRPRIPTGECGDRSTTDFIKIIKVALAAHPKNKIDPNI